DSHPGVQLLQ
ncbi:hypothetical protein BN1708_019951, partial [Verticillium longisporum]